MDAVTTQVLGQNLDRCRVCAFSRREQKPSLIWKKAGPIRGKKNFARDYADTYKKVKSHTFQKWPGSLSGPKTHAMQNIQVKTNTYALF